MYKTKKLPETFLQKLQRADLKEPTEGCQRNHHSCYKGVIKLRRASLVQAIKSTVGVKASLMREESFITRVELQYMITSPCFGWPSLLLKLLIDPLLLNILPRARCACSRCPLLCRLSAHCVLLNLNPPQRRTASAISPHPKCCFLRFLINAHISSPGVWKHAQTLINRYDKDTQMDQWLIFICINQMLSEMVWFREIVFRFWTWRNEIWNRSSAT